VAEWSRDGSWYRDSREGSSCLRRFLLAMTIMGSDAELRGCRAAVLGSTSGIGRAAALALAGAGADVIVHGRASLASAQAVAAEVRAKGVRAAVLTADLADRAAGDRLVDDAWALWGGLDAWLHIAGADTLTASL
jgi:3-oxoacyl-[acyl-carrier protein] reductase